MGMAGQAVGYIAGTDPSISLANNAIEFKNNPFAIDAAYTLGKAVIYSADTAYSSQTSPEGDAYGEQGVKLKDHEKGHTYQAQTLGPFYLPAYLLSGKHADVETHPMEKSAQNYGRSGEGKSWWPDDWS